MHKAAADLAPVPSVVRLLQAKLKVELKKCNFTSEKAEDGFSREEVSEEKPFPEL